MKYRLIKIVNFTKIILKILWKQITLKYIQYTMKENLLLLRDLLEHWKNFFFKTYDIYLKNVYFDVLDDIVDKYNNTVHRTIKIKPIDVMILMLNTIKILIKKIVNLKLVTMLKSENTKTFLLKNMPQIGPKKFLLLVKLKIKFLGFMLLRAWMMKKLLNVFIKKKLQKISQKKN